MLFVVCVFTTYIYRCVLGTLVSQTLIAKANINTYYRATKVPFNDATTHLCLLRKTRKNGDIKMNVQHSCYSLLGTDPI